MPAKSDLELFITTVREILSPFGRDYALGAVRGLAVRNMMSVDLPETSEGFYPIVKVHGIALKDLEEEYYRFLHSGSGYGQEELIIKLVEEEVWEERSP